jgi:A/G-specific adenine glycosylase
MRRMEGFQEEAEALLEWYRRGHRELPWRRTRDPWAIWVSEVMLQQTRVEHVTPYFDRFLARFPDPASLAAAPLAEALALWSGLGYYRRVRLLHRAAGMVAGGGLPRHPDALRGLPGIGDYTAAAIASIAFDVPVPVLDGNVERVICRLRGEREDPRRAATRRRLLGEAAALLVPGSPGESNQALMELGATLCVPRQPHCAACPLAEGCMARRTGEAELLPRRAARRRLEQVRLVVARVQRGERVLLFRRSESDALLAGTWELPWVRDQVGHQVRNEVRDVVRDVVRHEVRDAVPGEGCDGGRGEGVPYDDLEAALLARYGVRLRLGAERHRVSHAITFRRLLATVYEATLDDEAGEVAEALPGEAGWFTREQIAALPVSSLVGKALGWRLRGPGHPWGARPGRRRRG